MSSYPPRSAGDADRFFTSETHPGLDLHCLYLAHSDKIEYIIGSFCFIKASCYPGVQKESRTTALRFTAVVFSAVGSVSSFVL